jgi:hypothetical protein
MEFRKNMKLSKEDKLLIDVTVEGCKEIINGVISRDAKRDAHSSTYEEKKSLTHMYISSMPKIDTFRPADIRDSLPDKIKNISPADLSRAITSSLRVKKTPYSENQCQRKRGHPKTHDEPDTSLSGPKSYYNESNFEYKINRLLSKSEVVELIYKRLCKLNLLFQLEKYVQRWIYYNMRIYDVDKAWERCRSIYQIRRKDFDKAYEQIGKMSETDLELRADMIAKKNIKSRPPARFIGLFKGGAISFFQELRVLSSLFRLQLSRINQ